MGGGNSTLRQKDEGKPMLSRPSKLGDSLFIKSNGMTLEEAVLQNLRELPPDQRKAVLDFAEFLRSKTALPQAAQSLKGLWADLDVDISEDDISIARQEMWGDFPIVRDGAMCFHRSGKASEERRA